MKFLSFLLSSQFALYFHLDHWYLVKLGFGESFLVTLFGVDDQSTGWWGRLAMFFFHLTAMMLSFGNETSFVLVDNDILCDISLTGRKSLQA